MKGVLQKYIQLIDVLNKLCGWGLAVIMAVMSVLIFWQVVARYVLGSSLAWSEELSRFLMILMVMVGSALALRKGSLLAVEILPELVRESIKRWIRVATHLFSFVFYVILIVYGWNLAQNFGMQFAPGTGLSMFWVYLSLPIGGLLLLLNSVACLLEEFIAAKE